LSDETRYVTGLAATGTSAEVYAIDAGEHLYVSVDDGATWTDVTASIGGERALSVSAGASGTVYVGTFVDGSGWLWRKEPSGSWQKGGTYFASIWEDPNDPAIVYAASVGLHRSSDRGMTWTLLAFAGKQVSLVTSDNSTPAVLYAVVSGLLHKSPDGGVSWEKLDIAPDIGEVFGAILSIVVDPSNPRIIYSGTEKGIFRSTNGGAGWTRFSNGLHFRNGLYRSVPAVAIEPSGHRLYGATDGLGVVTYDITPSRTLPAVAALHGAGGAFFHSDVSLLNLFDGTLDVAATYRCSLGSCAEVNRVLSLEPRRLRTERDIVGGLFGSPDSGGSVQLEGDLPFVVTSRLYTPELAEPTTGMFVPSLAPEESSAIQTLLLLSRSGESRTNVGAVNTSDVPQTMTFSLFDPSGSAIGSLSRYLAPREAVQINDPALGAAISAGVDSSSFYAIVEGDGSHPLAAYAAVIDNQSQDPFFVRGSDGRRSFSDQLGGGHVVTLPAAASLHGRNGAYFHSDVAVWNRSYYPADVSTRYRCFGGAGACGNSEQSFSLAPGEMRVFVDIVRTLFDSQETGGAVEFESSQEIVVASRLYSPERPGPTVGMFVPGQTMGEATLSAVLTSLSHSTDASRGFRTNAGAFNPTDQPLPLRFEVFAADGSPLGQWSATLAPRAAVQVNDLFRSAGVGIDVPDAYCLVEGDGIRAFFAYAAVLDNRSQDPIFVPGQPNPKAPPAPVAR
jgi:hypothetical protein